MRTKYVLIERGEEFKRTAVSMAVAKDIERRGLGVVGKAITLKQIKEDRIHIYHEEAYVRHMAQRDFEDKYEGGKKFKAVVTWFDTCRGSGSVRLEDGLMMPLYACNIEGKKTWFPETACVYHEAGQEIEVSIKCGLVVSHTVGILDTEKWNSLDQSRLAFKCNEAGQAINGLFK